MDDIWYYWNDYDVWMFIDVIDKGFKMEVNGYE